MGVDVRIMLPGDVRLRDVGNIIGILAGLPIETRHIKDTDTPYVTVNGVKVEGTVMIPEMAIINLTGKMVDGEERHYATYHYETEDSGVLMIPPSTEFWVAIGIELCKFFGGKIDYNDCDEGKWNRTFKKPRKKNNPQDNSAWAKFQKEILDLKPLTTKDLLRVQKYACYKKISLTEKVEKVDKVEA